MLIGDFDYELPGAAIAQSAIEPRHDSRLLLASGLTEIPFHQMASLFRAGDLLVVNRTKVRAARLIGSRVPTGGRSELLLTKRIDPHRWEALVRPAKRMTKGTIIDCEDITVELLSDPVEGVATLGLTSTRDIEDAIARVGEIPLPPYFHGSLDSPDRYQTLFATRIGSSAAPTAALHFTDDVVSGLADKGVRIAEVELEVGLDTFRPMGDGLVEDHLIHSERVVVDASAVAAVDRVRATGGRVIAVGTTVVRTLETAATGDGRIRPLEGETDLFITPGYRFSVVDGVLTNFHAPRTTLIVMIAAMLGDRWREVYDHALEERFRFLSFGDAMYIEIKK
ncbi:MAG: tRNA preQ1(34) S-adenosylmethionine ribosyltransferase-isomerase QueA [Actinobacteria bacterium]|nr:MAG: tRNA preQ1(34) S-adenosylmethionine ribosyltransferase-isomerase QueA [Actinomycetota bacterium]